MEKIPQIDWSRVGPTRTVDQAISLLAVTLGYPPDIPLVRIVDNRQGHWKFSEDTDTGRWQFDIRGIPILSIPDHPDEPPDVFAYSRVVDGRRDWYRPISMRAQRPNLPVVVEREYRSDGTFRYSISGINEVASNAAFQALMRVAWDAFCVLDGPKSSIGRPLGTGQPVTSDNVAYRYWEWIDHKGKPPTQDNPEFAAQFFLSVSQFKARLAQLRATDGFTWPPPRPD